MLRLHAAREPKNDFIFEVEGLQDPLQRLVGDLRPLPLGKTRMRQIIKHLATHGIHVLLPDSPIYIRDLSQ